MLDLKSYVLVLSRKCLLSTKGTPAPAACTTTKWAVCERGRIRYLKAQAITSLTQTYARYLLPFLGATGSVSAFLLSAVLGACWKAGVAFTACGF